MRGRSQSPPDQGPAAAQTAAGERRRGGDETGVNKNGEEVAVKLLYSDRLGLEHEQFQKEFDNLTRLNHPNIASFVGYCYGIRQKHIEYEGENISARKTTRALCFEYLHNGSLQKYLSDEYDGIDWHTRYKIIKGICEGLRYLHEEFEEPICHLNLKPDNILLDKNMVPKLADFGLSNLIGEEQTRITHSYLGTNGYLPPEYVQRPMASTKVDIFSLGVVIMKIVTGTRGCSKCAELPPQEFIGVVRRNWRRRLSAEMSSGSSLEAYCQQVERCIEIALKCVENDRDRRPNIMDIIDKLNETETLMNKSRNNPGPLIGKAIKIITGIYAFFQFFIEKLLIKQISDNPSREVRRYSFQDLEHITDKFSEERMIGEGVFGAVYKGVLQDRQVIAVKRLNHDARLPERLFESEVSLKRMEHKNIVRLDGYCYETREEAFLSNNTTQKYICRDVTERFLCYEFFPGGSLDAILFGTTTRQGLDWKARCSIIQGICQGVHYLHEACPNAPIVHMDLNPANILLDDDMVPKLGDFGLSKIFLGKVANTNMNVVGSVGYMAPEYANSGIVTTKTDIFSLGILIIEIVTGEKCTTNRTDHSDRSFVQKVEKNLTKDFLILSKYPSPEGCSIQKIKSLIKMGLRCVEERPEERPTIGQIIRFLACKFTNTEGVTLDGEVMAVKRFDEYTGRSEQQFTGERQFKSELKRLMSLEHENVLQLKGYCDDVAQVLVFSKHDQLEWLDSYRIIKGICQGLRYLHERYEAGHTIHVAVKPWNILLDASIVPKIGSFSLQRLDCNSNGANSYDPMKSDMYGLGVLIMEIVTGYKCPSKDKEIAARAFIDHVQQNWTDDHQIASECPSLGGSRVLIQQVKNCIETAMRCVDDDPRERPTASQMTSMVQKEFTDHPHNKRSRDDSISSTPPHETVEPERGFIKRLRRELNREY
ncbi:putative receptor-like protein kinase [Dichanthelium oligosanthes]|uniref:Putative receptor-like protein kinase n=1 Tax=Dichanthelium oligosanthes TaxID=888268 RepID=A0A1E5UNA8_9POAL|nr:putative receptor-like protein kinase [Dichanthelium oligosanthes]